ncbi:MAG: DUF2619 domain-containing protein [Bacteroidales bacterium]
MDNHVWAMGLTRAIYAILNITAALVIWKLADISSAMKINAVFGSIMGPLTFLLVSGFGMAGLSKSLSLTKMALIIVGIVLILIGTRR